MRLVAALLTLGLCRFAFADAPLAPAPEVLRDEQRRIEVVGRVSRATIAIFESSGTNGGSGVLISEDGLAVTNYHVTAPCGPAMLVGTNDGRVHRAVLLGIDPTGDIALIRLLSDEPFPTAKLGDSDQVRVGDEAIVVGNPFLLAEDFTPSVSTGIISGVHRYQFPAGTLLEYADCLQTDAAINPGNSGGPLFDGQGRLIGINGRGSFEKRGRVNVGVGYAVSINQVKRFVSHLAAGRVVDHASLGATVVDRAGPRAIVNAIEVTADAYRRGLRPGDEIVSLGGRDTPTGNALLNAVGVLPAGWRTRLEYRHDGQLARCEIRLTALHGPGELDEAIAAMAPDMEPPAPTLKPDVYLRREGYANYAAQAATIEQLLARCRRAAPAGSPRSVRYTESVRGESVQLAFGPDDAAWLAPSGEFRCRLSGDLGRQAVPPAAPGFMGALWVLRTLVAGEEGLLDRVEAYGDLPWDADGPACPVLVATHHGLRVGLFFDPQTGRPIGIEASRDESEDAVRIKLSGAAASPAMVVTVGERLFADLVPEPPTSEEQP